MFATLIAPCHADEETGAPVLSAHLLASLEGKTRQFQSRNYCGDAFIERYREQTGHHIELTAADYRQGRARTLAALNLDPALHRAWEQELTTVTDERVAFVSGRRVTRQHQADYRRLTLSLGLRRGEVLGLRWQDMDLDGKTLRITVALQRFKGKLQLMAPKTYASARQLPLPEVLVAALRAHRATQELERAVAGGMWEEHGLVFPTHRGTPMEPRNMIRHFKTALKAAGLPETIRFHDLRHSCATFLMALRAGAKRHRPGCPPPCRDGDPRPLADQRDDEHLRPRPARVAAPGGGEAHESVWGSGRQRGGGAWYGA